jgi:hypothetical protein
MTIFIIMEGGKQELI